MKVYLAGPMSGHADNNFPAFADAAAALRSAGHDVVSPHEINLAQGFNPQHIPTEAQYKALLRADVRALIDCDAVAMLPGWQHSMGAQFERNVAHQCGLRVLLLEVCPGPADYDDGS